MQAATADKQDALPTSSSLSLASLGIAKTASVPLDVQGAMHFAGDPATFEASTGSDQQLSIISGGEGNHSKLFLSTPNHQSALRKYVLVGSRDTS